MLVPAVSSSHILQNGPCSHFPGVGLSRYNSHHSQAKTASGVLRLQLLFALVFLLQAPAQSPSHSAPTAAAPGKQSPVEQQAEPSSQPGTTDQDTGEDSLPPPAAKGDAS